MKKSPFGAPRTVVRRAAANTTTSTTTTSKASTPIADSSASSIASSSTNKSSGVGAATARSVPPVRSVSITKSTSRDGSLSSSSTPSLSGSASKSAFGVKPAPKPRASTMDSSQRAASKARQMQLASRIADDSTAESRRLQLLSELRKKAKPSEASVVAPSAVKALAKSEKNFDQTMEELKQRLGKIFDSGGDDSNMSVFAALALRKSLRNQPPAMASPESAVVLRPPSSPIVVENRRPGL